MVNKNRPAPSWADAAHLFHLLADENRLRILRILIDKGEVCVGALAADLGAAQPVVSNHLKSLRLGGVVECRRDGQNRLYRLTSPVVPQLLDAVLGELAARSRSN